MLDILGFFIIPTIVILIILISRGRKIKALRYESLDTNEKILYNLEQVNDKTPSPLEELFWCILGIAFGLALPFIILYSLFN